LAGSDYHRLGASVASGPLLFAKSINVGVLCKHQLVAPVERLFELGLLFLIRQSHQYARGGSFCLAGFSNFCSALYIDIGDVFVFAKDGQVGEHVDWGDVGCDYDEALGALADGLDGFLDAAVNELVLHALLN